MKVWVVIFRADAEAIADGVEDDFFLVAYRTLAKAKKECEGHLKDLLEESEITDFEIEWAETTPKGKARKFLGRPKAEVDGTFDLHQVEVL